MLSVKSIFHDFPSSGSSLPPPRVTTCRCQEPAMVTTSWPTTTWRWVAGWWRSCCQAFLSLVVAGSFFGDREGEVWILGEVKAPAGPASDFQVRDRRPKVGRKGDAEEGGVGLMQEEGRLKIENWKWKYFQVTDLDKLHSQQQTEGENKYSTIQKVNINANTNTEGEKRMIHKVKRYFQVKRGSTSSRVAFFEEL